MPQFQHSPSNHRDARLLSWLATITSDDTLNSADMTTDNNGSIAAAAADTADVTPKTPKRRRNDDFDVDQTPKVLQLPPAQGSLDARYSSESLSQCSQSASSTSNPSSRNSPRKRVIALRQTVHYPVYQQNILNRSPPPLP
jgi:hypothetical protein